MTYLLPSTVSINIIIAIIFLGLSLESCTSHRPNDKDISQYIADTSYVNQLNETAFRFWSTNPDSLLILGEKALKISDDLGYLVGKTNTLTVLGAGYYEKGDYARSIDHYKQALEIAISIPNETLEAKIRNNISMPLIALGIYDEALKNVFAALAIGERINQAAIIAHAYHNLGMVYHYQEKYDQALTYYQQSKSAYEAMGDLTKMTFLIGNIAHIHLNRKEYKEAWEYYMTSLKLAKKYGNQKGIGNALLSLGALCLEEGKNIEALDYLFQAKRTLELVGEKTEYLRLLQNLSSCYFLLGEQNQAMHYALQGYELAQQQQQLWYVKEFAETLAEKYEQANDYKFALSYQKTANITADSLSNLDMKEQIVRLEEKYKYEKQQHEIESAYTNQLSRKQDFLYLLTISATALILGVILLLRNIKQKKESNTILQQTNEKIAKQHELIEKADAFKSHLISIVAHDIRTPIATLHMILNLVDDDFLPKEKKKQLIVSSRSEVESLAHFVDNLLLWVMKQLGEGQIEKIHFDIKSVAQEIMGLYRQQAKSKHLELSVQIQENIPIYADVETLKIILRNLIDNAIKFCEMNGRVTIAVSREEDTGKIKISVSDTGYGIDEKTKASIFTTSTDIRLKKSNGKGSGLGLILCQQYLQLNDSTLHVESESGKGSTFWFLLPSGD